MNKQENMTNKSKQLGLFSSFLGGFSKAIVPTILGFLWTLVCMALILISITFISVSLSGIFVDAHGVVEIATSIIVFLFVVSVACAICNAACTETANIIGSGWTGMITKERPVSFHSTEENIKGIYLHAFVFFMLALFGFLWFQEGQSTAYVQFSLNGLLLIFCSIFFGVLPLVPRLYYFTDSRHGEIKTHAQKKLNDALHPRIFLILLILGMACSLGVNEIILFHKTQKNELVMAYGETYTFTKTTRSTKDKTARLIINTPREGILLFTVYKCDVRFEDSNHTYVQPFSRTQVTKLNLESGGDVKIWAFEVRQDEQYTATLSIDFCTVQYRIIDGVQDE